MQTKRKETSWNFTKALPNFNIQKEIKNQNCKYVENNNNINTLYQPCDKSTLC